MLGWFKMAENNSDSSLSLVSDNANLQKQTVDVVQKEYQEASKTEDVLGPMLVEDISDESLPKTYENVRKHLERSDIYLDRNDVIVILLYICMLEMGFVPVGLENECAEDTVDFSYKRIVTLTRHCPANWKKPDSYGFAFTLLPFPLYSCNLTIVKTSDDLIVNCYVKNIEGCSTCCLIDPLLYVVSSATDMRQIRFQNTRSLSNKFKTDICYPMKIAILMENGIWAPHFLSLPSEIILHVAKNFQTLSTLGRFQQVCRAFKDATEEEKLWKRLINKECPTEGYGRELRKRMRADAKITKLGAAAKQKRLQIKNEL